MNTHHKRIIREDRYYREVMSRLFERFKLADRHYTASVEKQSRRVGEVMGWLGDFLERIAEENRQFDNRRRRDFLARIGRVCKQMERDGFHQQRIFTALNAAQPIAYERQKNRNAKAEQGDRPRSRVGRSARMYRIPAGESDLVRLLTRGGKS